MNITLDHLRCFKITAETRSFTKAAEKCYMTQPALSRMMAALEREWQVRLFQRTTRSVSLTPEGELCLKRVRTILRQYDGMISEMNAMQLSAGGELSVGFNVAAGAQPWFLSSIRQMMEQYPELHMNLKEIHSNESVFLVGDRELDCALIFDHSAALTQGLETRRLCKVNTYAVLARENPLAGQRTISFRNLAGKPVVFMKNSEEHTYTCFHARMRQLGLTAGDEKFADGLTEMVFHIDLTGAIGISGLVPRYGENDRYVRVPIDAFNAEDDDWLSLAWRKKNGSPWIATLLNTIQKHIGDL